MIDFTKAPPLLASCYDIDTNGCWIWNKALKTSGYGVKWFENRLWPAHRLSFLAHGGIIYDGHDCCHSCNVKRCINPAHIYSGTRLDNMQQSVREGRSGKKLSAEDVLAIRKILAEIPRGKHSQIAINKAIGEQFGVSYKSIEFIQKGITYGNFCG